MLLTERLYFAFDFDSVLSSSATARGGTAASETWPDVKLSLKRFQNAKKSPPPYVPRSNWQHKVQVPFLPSSLLARSVVSQKLDHRRQFVVILRFAFLSSILLLAFLPASSVFSHECSQLQLIVHDRYRRFLMHVIKLNFSHIRRVCICKKAVHTKQRAFVLCTREASKRKNERKKWRIVMGLIAVVHPSTSSSHCIIIIISSSSTFK